MYYMKKYIFNKRKIEKVHKDSFYSTYRNKMQPESYVLRYFTYSIHVFPELQSYLKEDSCIV